ncbi:DUF2971 domain-containing protein [Gemmatimonadota bacterium]
MAPWPEIVERFPLTIERVLQQYTRIPADATEIFYHYTDHAGLAGILKEGGLRAKYRKNMNDAGEFEYAKNVIYESLEEFAKHSNLPIKPVQSFTTYTRKNLDLFLDPTTEKSSSYCACLSVSPDNAEQWDGYGEQGKGFAIGFDLNAILNTQIPAVLNGKPYIYCAPVCYNQSDQHNLVWQLLEAGISDVQTFAFTVSQKPEHITALRDRVTQEIIVHLLTLINFIKSPDYSSEREMRLMLNAIDGILKSQEIQYFDRDNESIPYIFFDLRNPKTGRLPLSEIKIGPKASFSEGKIFIDKMLDDMGYGKDYDDRPRIVHSSLAE